MVAPISSKFIKTPQDMPLNMRGKDWKVVKIKKDRVDVPQIDWQRRVADTPAMQDHRRWGTGDFLGRGACSCQCFDFQPGRRLRWNETPGGSNHQVDDHSDLVGSDNETPVPLYQVEMEVGSGCTSTKSD